VLEADSGPSPECTCCDCRFPRFRRSLLHYRLSLYLKVEEGLAVRRAAPVSTRPDRHHSDRGPAPFQPIVADGLFPGVQSPPEGKNPCFRVRRAVARKSSYCPEEAPFALVPIRTNRLPSATASLGVIFQAASTLSAETEWTSATTRFLMDVPPHLGGRDRKDQASPDDDPRAADRFVRPFPMYTADTPRARGEPPALSSGMPHTLGSFKSSPVAG